MMSTFTIAYAFSLKSMKKSDIRFIDYDTLKDLKTFPRCPDRPDCISLLSDIDRDKSLLIFVSHCWLRGNDKCEGWTGEAHPDNKYNDKFELCVEGIEELKEVHAPKMEKCYIWMDYCCMDQENRKAIPQELKQYDQIVACCDLIFTPIVDKMKQTEVFSNPYVHHQSPLWNGKGSQSYMNRAWCRAEMMYAANIPILENDDADVKRHTMFKAGLAFSCKLNRRPHFLYGYFEVYKLNYLVILPPLQSAWFVEYNPLDGCLSDPTDIDNIKQLMTDLWPYIESNRVEYGYTGERNKRGQKHGRGRNVTASCVYEGEYRKDREHGQGVLSWINGEVNEGEFVNGELNGRATLRLANGDVYEGDMKDDMMHGVGVYKHTNGEVYTGEWRLNKMNGSGTYTYPNGNVFTGQWKNDEIAGPGWLKCPNGDVYEGKVKYGLKEGFGRLTYSSGDVYEGEFKQDMRHGVGVLMVLSRGKRKSHQQGLWKKNEFVGEQRRSKRNKMNQLPVTNTLI